MMIMPTSHILILIYFISIEINCLEFIPEESYNVDLQINLTQGIVQGMKKSTMEMKIFYYSFEGIPYAKPPVGSLRFRSPEPADNWDGVLDGTHEPPACVQLPENNFFPIQSEDCLYINVYTPDTRANLPVMVWIYGGGFLIGAAQAHYYGPDRFLEQNVVFVAFNYRLNVFGFLSTGDLNAAGNWGLKDQNLALHWVRDNIAKFGGDPENVTIFGESAGGVSVEYQLVSPKSRGLFQKAIAESGSALCIWSMQKEPQKIAFKLGRFAGIFTKNPQTLVEKLREMDVERIMRAALKVTVFTVANLVDDGISFAPTLEIEHPDAFLDGTVYDALNAGRFDHNIAYLIGRNSIEFAFAQFPMQMVESFINFQNLKSELVVPPRTNRDMIEDISGKIKNYYTQNTTDTVHQYLEYITDSYFNRPILQSARMHAKHSSVYLYRFSYEGKLGRTFLGVYVPQKVRGVIHGEEMWYLFTRAEMSSDVDGDDRLICDRMVRFWTNFAKFGNPTPEKDEILQNIIWPKLDPTTMFYLDIDVNLTLDSAYESTSLPFWDDIYENYGQPPYDTY